MLHCVRMFLRFIILPVLLIACTHARSCLSISGAGVKRLSPSKAGLVARGDSMDFLHEHKLDDAMNSPHLASKSRKNRSIRKRGIKTYHHDGWSAGKDKLDGGSVDSSSLHASPFNNDIPTSARQRKDVENFETQLHRTYSTDGRDTIGDLHGDAPMGRSIQSRKNSLFKRDQDPNIPHDPRIPNDPAVPRRKKDKDDRDRNIGLGVSGAALGVGGGILGSVAVERYIKARLAMRSRLHQPLTHTETRQPTQAVTVQSNQQSQSPPHGSDHGDQPILHPLRMHRSILKRQVLSPKSTGSTLGQPPLNGNQTNGKHYAELKKGQTIGLIGGVGGAGLIAVTTMAVLDGQQRLQNRRSASPNPSMHTELQPARPIRVRLPGPPPRPYFVVHSPDGGMNLGELIHQHFRAETSSPSSPPSSRPKVQPSSRFVRTSSFPPAEPRHGGQLPPNQSPQIEPDHAVKRAHSLPTTELSGLHKRDSMPSFDLQIWNNLHSKRSKRKKERARDEKALIASTSVLGTALVTGVVWGIMSRISTMNDASRRALDLRMRSRLQDQRLEDHRRRVMELHRHSGRPPIRANSHGGEVSLAVQLAENHPRSGQGSAPLSRQDSGGRRVRVPPVQVENPNGDITLGFRQVIEHQRTGHTSTTPSRQGRGPRDSYHLDDLRNWPPRIQLERARSLPATMSPGLHKRNAMPSLDQRNQALMMNNYTKKENGRVIGSVLGSAATIEAFVGTDAYHFRTVDAEQRAAQQRTQQGEQPQEQQTLYEGLHTLEEERRRRFMEILGRRWSSETQMQPVRRPSTPIPLQNLDGELALGYRQVENHQPSRQSNITPIRQDSVAGGSFFTSSLQVSSAGSSARSHPSPDQAARSIGHGRRPERVQLPERARSALLAERPVLRKRDGTQPSYQGYQGSTRGNFTKQERGGIAGSVIGSGALAGIMIGIAAHQCIKTNAVQRATRQAEQQVAQQAVQPALHEGRRSSIGVQMQPVQHQGSAPIQVHHPDGEVSLGFRQARDHPRNGQSNIPSRQDIAADETSYGLNRQDSGSAYSHHSHRSVDHAAHLASHSRLHERAPSAPLTGALHKRDLPEPPDPREPPEERTENAALGEN